MSFKVKNNLLSSTYGWQQESRSVSPPVGSSGSCSLWPLINIRERHTKWGNGPNRSFPFSLVWQLQIYFGRLLQFGQILIPLEWFTIPASLARRDVQNYLQGIKILWELRYTFHTVKAVLFRRWWGEVSGSGARVKEQDRLRGQSWTADWRGDAGGRHDTMRSVEDDEAEAQKYRFRKTQGTGPQFVSCWQTEDSGVAWQWEPGNM